MSRRTRLAATAAVAGLIAMTGAGVAHAAISGNASAGNAVTAASWGVTPKSTAGATLTGPLVWQSGQIGLVPQYFAGVNTGTTTLTGSTWTVTVGRVDNNGNNVPAIKFEVCVNGTWNAATGLCSTLNVVTLGQTPKDKGATSFVSTSSTTTPFLAGAAINVKATPQSTNGQNFQAAIATTVSSATQIRADLVTNS